VALPQSAFTTFVNNTALQGGGGAVFWEDEPPKNTERYRNESMSNTALYGDYVATPARQLVAANYSHRTVSGGSMATDPVTIEFRDWYGQIARSANDEVVYGNVRGSAANVAEASGAIGIVTDGTCRLDDMAVAAPLGSMVGLELSSSMTSLTWTSSVMVNIRVARDCPRGYFLTGKDVCEACETGKYSLAFSETVECKLCPPKSATCLGGDALVTADGWWRTSTLSDEMWPCPMEGNCKAGTNASFLGKCRRGSEGPLCGVCAPDFYNAGYECRSCEDSTSKEFFFIIALAAGLCATVAWKIRIARVHRKKTLSQSVWSALTTIFDGQRAKIAWQTIQITSSIAWTTSIKWPEPFKSFSELLTNLAELSLIPVDCINQNMDYWGELVIATVVPVGLVALAWLIARLAPNRISAEKKAVTFTLFVAFIVLPMVSTKIFRTFLVSSTKR
jgi:hypothetical protein